MNQFSPQTNGVSLILLLKNNKLIFSINQRLLADPSVSIVFLMYKDVIYSRIDASYWLNLSKSFQRYKMANFT